MRILLYLLIVFQGIGAIALLEMLMYGKPWLSIFLIIFTLCASVALKGSTQTTR